MRVKESRGLNSKPQGERVGWVWVNTAKGIIEQRGRGGGGEKDFSTTPRGTNAKAGTSKHTNRLGKGEEEFFNQSHFGKKKGREKKSKMGWVGVLNGE